MPENCSSSFVALALTLGLPISLLIACGDSAPTGQSTGAEGISASTSGDMQDDESSSTASQSSSESATDTGTGSESGTETETETETETDEGDAINFDLGVLPDSPPLEEGCGMVDFLFVIDNSGSMSDEQI